uniref:(northern house mosquito) hypothetical protein n=1 Tax=Culex pipiens TaxID=7175 RepID=A0A8D8IC02_CULPI
MYEIYLAERGIQRGVPRPGDHRGERYARFLQLLCLVRNDGPIRSRSIAVYDTDGRWISWNHLLVVYVPHRCSKVKTASGRHDWQATVQRNQGLLTEKLRRRRTFVPVPRSGLNSAASLSDERGMLPGSVLRDEVF